MITEFLKQILSARYGRDVRQAIHDGIQQCYYDGKAGTIDLEARQDIEAIGVDVEALKENTTSINKAVADLQAVVDITATTETTLPNSHAGRLKVDEIGGVMEQDSTTGKNLLDCRGLTEQTLNGGTFTPIYDENGNLQYVEVNGTFNAGTGYTVGSHEMIDGNEYILSGCPSGGSGSTYQLLVSNFGVDNGSSVNEIYDSSTMNATAQIHFWSGVTADHLRFYPMIRRASVADPTYEPYTGGQPAPNPSYPMEIKKSVVSGVKTHGKNFLNFDLYYSNLWSNLDATRSRENNKLIIGTTAYYYSGIYSHHAPLNLTGIIVTVSFDVTISNGSYIYTGFGTNSKIIPITPNVKKRISFTDNVDTGAFIIYSGEAVAKTITIENIQYELGEVATDYEPYTESSITFSQPIELYGKDGVQDILTPQEIGRKYKKVVFDGSNYSVTKQTSNGYERFYIHNILAGKKPIASGAFVDLLVSHYTISYAPIAGNNVDETACGFYGNDNLFIRSDRFTSVEEFNAYFAQNPMEIVFAIEPTTEALPITDQIGLNSLLTYDGITHVEFIYDELEPTFKGKYGTSEVGGMTLESLLVARNNDLRISALEA